MKKTLVVGCSFVYGLYLKDSSTFPYKPLGTPGTGNAAIAANLYNELAKNTYENVIVIWTGINRLDLPIPRPYQKILPIYNCITKINDVAWYHSGGIGASYACDAPKEIKTIFDTQYKGASQQFLTDLSLIPIIGVQSYLEANNIPYKMSFIYDIHSDEYTTSWLETVLGKIDTTSAMYNLVKWDKFVQEPPPFEWCRDQNLLMPDNFHPTYEGMVKWLELIG